MLAGNTAPFTGEMRRIIGTAAEAVNSGYFIGECNSFSVSAFRSVSTVLIACILCLSLADECCWNHSGGDEPLYHPRR